jgi:2-polyprenyl-6-methoxyphenol hydroxylase-like FAD-dependent oxidoreductase
MGGMMAAEVLSRFFDEVVVLEKDALPMAAEARMGVPQGAHVHALLVGGRRNLETLFPGFTSELMDRGAMCSRSGLEFCVHDAAGWQPRRDLQLPLFVMSRPLLEGTVRDLLKRNPRVTIRDKTRLEGWAFADDTLTGVVVAGDEGNATIACDLAVDASGRNGGSLSWLQAAGFGPVEETTLEIGTGYASAVFKKPKGWHSSVDCLSIHGADPDTRGGFAFCVENDCWFVSLTGRFDQAPSGDPDQYLAFAKSLCVPDLFDWISQGERITPIRVYRAPVSRWRRYETLGRFPEGLVPLGDAVAHVNPLFGQGMTLASMHAMSLMDLLAQRVAAGEGLRGIAAPYFERTGGFTQTVWQGLENIEFTYAATRGDRPADIDGRLAYNRGLRQLIVEDEEVHRLLISVGHLVEPPSTLGRPDIASRVMKIAQRGA